MSPSPRRVAEFLDQDGVDPEADLSSIGISTSGESECRSDSMRQGADTIEWEWIHAVVETEVKSTTCYIVVVLNKTTWAG